VALAAVGVVSVFRPSRPEPQRQFGRFLAVYTLVLTVIYAGIRYKTPWCMLSFLDGMIVLAGIGAAAIIGAVPRLPLKLAAAGLLIAGAVQLGWQCYALNFRFSADARNPYVYAHTSTDIRKFARQMERLAPAKEDRIGVADSLLMRPTIMVVFDTVRDEISIVTPVRPRPGVTAKAAYEAALARLDGIVATLEAPLDHRDAGCDPQMLTAEPVSNTPKPRFLEMVERAKEYIRAGDIFQVVLSQRFTAPFELPAFALYRALRRVNPAPFLCFLDFGAFQIVCSSPEILVRAAEGKVGVDENRRSGLRVRSRRSSKAARSFMRPRLSWAAPRATRLLSSCGVR
jgi:hypothetical protein